MTHGITCPTPSRTDRRPPLPGDVAAVVHCAYDLRARDRAEIERINLGGTKKLLQAVGDVPVVLISSMSAYAGTQQIYGRIKLACEDLVAARGGTSLRLGLVHGGGDGGMIGALRKVAALPLVPMLRPDSYQYAVHAEDMARCVVATIEQPPPHRVLGVANPRPVPFSEIIGTSARGRHSQIAPCRSGTVRAALSRIARQRGGRPSDRVPRRLAPRAHASRTERPTRRPLGQSVESRCGTSRTTRDDRNDDAFARTTPHTR